jgi:hypothetical protein
MTKAPMSKTVRLLLATKQRRDILHAAIAKLNTGLTEVLFAIDNKTYRLTNCYPYKLPPEDTAPVP